MATKENQQAQIDIAERLQLKWLEHMESLLNGDQEEGTGMTSTDLATLARVLMHNGWTIDPAKLPQGLREKITAKVDFDDDLPAPSL